MKKISDAVKEIIEGDEVAAEALRAGILNLSAYAAKIAPQVSVQLYKPVQKGSIVVALSRLIPSLLDMGDLRPPVAIEDMSIKSPLCDVTYEKTLETIKCVTALKGQIRGYNGFFTITQGTEEITIVFPESMIERVLRAFPVPPKGRYDHLAAVTVRFIEKDYIEAPNMIFTLVSAIARKRINLIEIVSAFTELSFIIRQKDMQATVDALRPHFRSV